MKILLSLLLFTLSFGGVFAVETISDPLSYEGYKKNIDTFCKLEANIPNKENLWNQWKENSFLTIVEPPYADITKKEEIINAEYKRYLQGIQADPSRIDIFWLASGPSFLEKASYVYKETMGATYACAVMNAKIRIINTLLTKIPVTQSNLKKQLSDQSKNLRKNFETGKKCREIKDTSELSVKNSLLDNTTYQYCTYRHYLAYLESASKNSLDAYYNAVKKSNPTPSVLDNTDAVAKKMAQSASAIQEEITHSKEVFPQAMVAFTEFERTYASHIILEFILQDYIKLRDSLKQLLNPIGQVIYKASNAQSPK